MRASRLIPLLVLVLAAVAVWRLGRPDRDEPVAPSTVETVRVEPLPGGRVKLVHEAYGIMGTRVVLTLFGEDEAALRAAARAALDRMSALEARLSSWRADSEISRLNEAAGRTLTVHPDTLALLRRALALGEETGGAFDVTAGPIIRLWKDRDGSPSGDDLARARALVGLDRVALLDSPEPAVRLAPGTRRALGGIAKGTIVDEAGALLRARGVAAFLVDAGGDMLARGSAPGGEGLLVGLRDPEGGRGSILAGGTIRLRDAAVCTSGGYERPHHIVDPRTGFPAPESVLQASVVAPDCETADALATALMVLGPAEGLPLVEARPGVEALLVVRVEGRAAVRESSGFATLRAEGRR